MHRPLLIAEVKTQSPFGFVSTKSWDELFEVANAHGDWLSIHTDPRWGGSFELLARARSLTTKPILAKGIHATDDDITRALHAGADYVLVVGRAPNMSLDKILLEPLALAELAAYPHDAKVVWNTRDLATGAPKTETLSDARAIWKGWLCHASNIRTPKDVTENVDAILVGEHLAQFVT